MQRRHFLALVLPSVVGLAALLIWKVHPPHAVARATTALTRPPVSTPALLAGNSALERQNAATCLACHGLNGQALIPAYPQLAGQHANYIVEQTLLITSGQRHSGLAAAMRGIASQVSEHDIHAIAQWYSRQPPIQPPSSALTTLEATRRRGHGRALYFLGDAHRAIPACSACHGAVGQGNPGPPYPRIGNQSADYLIRRLDAYKHADDRPQDDHRYRIMHTIASQLSDEDIRALAVALQTLSDPLFADPPLPTRPADP